MSDSRFYISASITAPLVNGRLCGNLKPVISEISHNMEDNIHIKHIKEYDKYFARAIISVNSIPKDRKDIEDYILSLLSKYAVELSKTDDWALDKIGESITLEDE